MIEIIGYHCVQYEVMKDQTTQTTKFIMFEDDTVKLISTRLRETGMTSSDCNECKHKLACLIEPECNRVFESNQ